MERQNLTTETRGESGMQILVSTLNLTSSNCPLCSFVSSMVNGFSVSRSFILTELYFDELCSDELCFDELSFGYIWHFVLPANSCRIGVRA